MAFEASAGANNLRAYDRRHAPKVHEVHVTAQLCGEFLRQKKEAFSGCPRECRHGQIDVAVRPCGVMDL